MTKDEVKKLFRKLAKASGYENKGKLYQRSTPEVTIFLEAAVQTHWDSDNQIWGGWHLDVYIGVSPTQLCNAKMPRDVSDCTLTFSLIHVPWKMHDLFWDLQFQNAELCPNPLIEEGFQELFAWIDYRLATPEHLRELIEARRDDTPGFAYLPFPTGMVASPMIDWANGQMKDPTEYRTFGPKPKAEPTSTDLDCSPCSFHFKTTDLAAVRDAAKKIIPRTGGTLAIAPPARGWVSAFPSDDIFDHGLAKRIAVKAGIAHALVLSVHDKDVACYWYYRDGKLVDYFNSCPDYFGEATRTDMRAKGNPAAFEGLLNAAAQKKLGRLIASRLIGEEGTEWVGDGPRFDIEDERIVKIAKVFGIKYLTEHSLDENGELIEIE